MNLNLNTDLAKGYKSKSQIARVLTENWVKENSYCPCCGQLPLIGYENNKPVADYYCDNCNEDYELKSKKGKLSKTISDGTYSTMIKRITSNQNPNFFLLNYSENWTVSNFMIVPKQFFTPEIIIKRKPLSSNAKRAGWVGCNIDISNISESGRVYIIKDSKVINQEIVQKSFSKTLFLREKSILSRGWLLDTMLYVDKIDKNEFSLKDIYKFENELQLKYPNNNFIKEKLRQQLQILRDKGIIEFMSRGKYKKISMKTFKIEIIETLSTVVETKANSIEEAVNKIEEEYRKSEIVLDAENHSSTNVDIFDISFIENNINFANFVLKKAEEALIDLSIEELAKIGFGSSIIAIDNFKKSKL